MSDETIVEKFWQRDESALTDLQTTYYRYCFYIAQKILCNEQDAEECVNDVLLAVWHSIPPHKPQNLRTYIGKLTRETAIDYLRKRTAQKRDPGEAIVSLDELNDLVGKMDEELLIQEEELAEHISTFLRSVKEDDRIIFVRRYWFFDSIDEISARFGYGKSRVLMKLKRTRDKLAQYLRKEGYDL